MLSQSFFKCYFLWECSFTTFVSPLRRPSPRHKPDCAPAAVWDVQFSFGCVLSRCWKMSVSVAVTALLPHTLTHDPHHFLYPCRDTCILAFTWTSCLALLHTLSSFSVHLPSFQWVFEWFSRALCLPLLHFQSVPHLTRR